MDLSKRRRLQRATRTRQVFAGSASALFLVGLIFLILCVVGNVHAQDRAVLGTLYMFRLDVSHIVPASVPNAQLYNSLAQTIGLHDFYQVGVWNFCEGYDDGRGVTACSVPVLGYWFNPVEIILDELLAGASISLPSEIYTYLDIIRTASRVMFGCFLGSTIACAICVVLCPLALYGRLWTIPIAIWSLVTALVAIVAAGISTAIWTIFSAVIRQNSSGINIVAETGLKFFVFQWIGAGCATLAALIMIGTTCCCTSRRDLTRMWKMRGAKRGEIPRGKAAPPEGDGEAGGGVRPDQLKVAP